MDEVLDKDNPDQAIAEKWKRLLKDEDQAHSKFREQGEKAEKQYKGGSDYNVMWSNVQIQKGALFSGKPNPEVRRRHKDSIGPQKQAALMLERALDYMVDSTDATVNLSRVVQDFLSAGLGVPRVKYKPAFEAVEFIDPITGESAQREVISSQMTTIEFVPWKTFHWQPCVSWDRCEWIAFDVTKTRRQVLDEYQVKAEEDEEFEDGEKRVKVTEIWHKPSRTIVVICDQYDVPLEVREDHLDLIEFYPVPMPLFANLCDKLTPKPDFEYYEKQAKQLDTAARRMDSLIEAVKDVGFYDSMLSELAILKQKRDGELVPVEGLRELINVGANLKDVIAKLPIDNTVNVIVSLQGYIETKKQEIYEIIGLSDIMRGASDAQEKATTQEIKAQFGSIRMSDKQTAVANCIRDLFRIMAEIIGEHFEPEILTKMTGVEATPEVMAILRDDVMRNFSVDVESESTIARDEQQEQQQRLEALKVITEYINGLLPGMMSGQLPVELGKELLLMSIRGFKYAGDLEDIISQLEPTNVAQMQQQMQQMQQQIQALQQELQKHSQVETMESVADIQKTRADTQLTLAKTAETKANAQTKQIENAANVANFRMGGPEVQIG